MNLQRKTQSLFAKSRVSVPAGVNDRMINHVLSAFDDAVSQVAAVPVASAPKRTAVSMIVRSAAGILVLAGVAAALSYLGLPFVGPRVALGQVREALNRTAWVHVLITDKTAGREHEMWLSPQREIRVTRSSDPNVPILWSDYLSRERRCYEPKSAKLTLSYEYGQAPEAHDPPWNYLSYMFGSDLPARARVTEQVETFKQTEVKVYSVTMEEEGGGVTHFKIIADKTSTLPIAMMVDVVDTTAQRHASIEARFDYPVEGPRDIYDAGVPRTATVVDDRPTPEVEELARICKAYRASLPSYIFVVVMTHGQGTVDQIEVSYVQGDTSRDGRECRSLTFMYVPWPPHPTGLDVGSLASVDDVLNWIKSDDRIRLWTVTLWDGKYNHSVRMDADEGPIYHKSRSIGSVKALHGFAWPCYVPSGSVSQDEYSRPNGFVCWRTQGRTLYFDPRHDYVCVRHEQSGGCSISDTLDFARTEAGLWYPRTVQLTIVQKNAQGQEISREVTHVDRLFLKPMPELAPGTFDARNLPRTIESKQAIPKP